jgi:hypothetical protein
MTWSVPSAGQFVDVMRDATVRTAGLLAAQTPEATEAIRAAAIAGVAPFAAPDGHLEIPMPAVISAGTKP